MKESILKKVLSELLDLQNLYFDDEKKFNFIVKTLNEFIFIFNEELKK